MSTDNPESLPSHQYPIQVKGNKFNRPIIATVTPAINQLLFFSLAS